MDDTGSRNPEPPSTSKRPAPKWLVEYLRLDQTGWNLLHERASSFAKAWFEWLNWIVILAALQVVATKYHSKTAAAVCWASYMIIYYHFHAIYWRSAPELIDPITGVRRRSMFSWFIAFIPAATLALLSQLLADSVSHAMP